MSKSARPTDDELRRTWALVAGAMRTTCAAKAAAGRSIRSAFSGRPAGQQVLQWTGTTRSGRVRRTASAACWGVEMTRTERGILTLHMACAPRTASTAHAAWDVCVTHGSLISDLQSSSECRFGQFQLTSDANPGRLVPGRFACVLSGDEDSPTPMRTPLPAEFAGSE